MTNKLSNSISISYHGSEEKINNETTEPEPKNKDPEKRPPHEIIPLDFTPIHLPYQTK